MMSSYEYYHGGKLVGLRRALRGRGPLVGLGLSWCGGDVCCNPLLSPALLLFLTTSYGPHAPWCSFPYFSPARPMPFLGPVGGGCAVCCGGWVGRGLGPHPDVPFFVGPFLGLFNLWGD